MLRLQLFGGLSLLKETGPQSGPVVQRRKLALLARTAASPRGSISRDKLIGCFWPEEDRERARHHLADSVFTLRKHLGKDALVTVGDDLVVNPEAFSCDLWQFLGALETGDAEQAVTLYAGPFLDGFFVSEAPEFEQWVEEERRRLTALYAGALEGLAEGAERREGPGRASSWWRRLAIHDPFSSRVALRYMQALAASGDRAAAVQHAKVHTALLRGEVGVEADPAIATLATELAAAPVVSIPDTAALSGTATAVPAGADSTEGPTIDGGGIEGTTGSSARDSSEKPHLPLPLRGSPRRLRRPHAVTFLALFLLALTAGAALWKSGPLAWPNFTAAAGTLEIPSAVFGERDPILLVDFVSPSGDSILAQAVTEALRIDLQQSTAVRLLESGEVQDALERMQRPRGTQIDVTLAHEIAQRDGIAALLTGELHSTGSSFILSARLVTAGEGRVIAALRETAADSTRILSAVDRLSERLRERIGESLGSLQRDEPLEQVTTSSLAALRFYSMGVRARISGDPDRAIVLLDEAIALDSSFALAYIAKALTEQSFAGRMALLRAAAFQHRYRLTERERYLALAAYHTYGMDFERAAVANRALLDLNPEDQFALSNLAVVSMLLHDFAEAERLLQRAIALDSARAGESFTRLAAAQADLGGFDRAAATLRAAERWNPGSPYNSLAAAHLASAQRRYVEADNRVRALQGAENQSLRVRQATAEALGYLAAVQGKLRKADDHFRDAADAARELGLVIPLFFQTRHQAVVAALRGQPEEGVTLVEAALRSYPLAEIEPLDRPYLYAAEIYLRMGRIADGRALVEEFEREYPPEDTRFHRPWRHQLRGLIALGEGRHDDAVAELRAGSAGDHCVNCGIQMLAEVYDRIGMADSAIATYERYLATPEMDRIRVDFFGLGPAHERLAELYEARGDRARAVAHSRRLVEMWEAADPELQPRVTNARQRIARLTPAGGGTGPSLRHARDQQAPAQ